LSRLEARKSARRFRSICRPDPPMMTAMPLVFLSCLAPADASLGFAVLFVAVCRAILAVLRRRGIIVKI